jgi:hypothetical protein
VDWIGGLRENGMKTVELAFRDGDYPSKQTESLAGMSAGFDFDQPRDGMMKIWANTDRKEETLIIPQANLISCRIIVERTR